MAAHPAIRQTAAPLLASLRKRHADGKMRTEHWGLLPIAQYLVEDEPPDPRGIDVTGISRHTGPQTSGSENHGPLLAGAATLGILTAPPGQQPALLAAHALAWERIYNLYRTVGHQGTEFGAPYGTWVAGGFACAAIVGAATGHEQLSRVGHAYLADDVACQGVLRTPNGVIIPVGSRMSARVDWTAPPLALRAQILNPAERPVGWLGSMISGGLPRGRKGWVNEGAVGELLLAHAVHSGAVDVGELRRLSAGLRPKVVSPVYRWQEGRVHRVRLPVTLGLPPVVWESSWTEGDDMPVIWGSAGESGQWGKNPHRFAVDPPGMEPVLTTRRTEVGAPSPPPPPTPTKEEEPMLPEPWEILPADISVKDIEEHPQAALLMVLAAYALLDQEKAGADLDLTRLWRAARRHQGQLSRETP